MKDWSASCAAPPKNGGKFPLLQTRKFIPFDPATKVAEATVTDAAGIERRIVKGAPLAVARLSSFDGRAERQIEASARSAGRVIAVAFGPSGAEKLVGLIALSDPPRPESKPLIAELWAEGVKTVMVTGDAVTTAASVGRAVGLVGPVCPAANFSQELNPEDYAIYAGVFPEDKFKLVQAFQRRARIVGMCGDGVNDAPALRQAQMGVAVSTATDVAKSAASVVLTEPGLKGVVDAIEEGRAAFQRILTYMLNALVKKFQLVPFLGVGLLATGHAIVTPMQMALLLITGDFLTMVIATDRATPSSQPDAWRLDAITGAAAALGVAGLLFVSTIVLVGERWLSLNIGQLRTVAFVSLVFLGQAAVYILRDRRRLWSSPPSAWLVLSSLLNLAIAVFFALGGYLMDPLPAWVILELFLATLAFALILDLFKLLVFRRFGLAAGPEALVVGEATRRPSPWVLSAGAAALAAIAATLIGLWPSTIRSPRNAPESALQAPATKFVIFQGTVMAAQQRLAVAAIGGTVGVVNCQPGETVEAGRLCATIYGEPHQRALGRLEAAKGSLAQYERLLSSRTPRRGGRHSRLAQLRRRTLARARVERNEIERLRAMLAEEEKNEKQIEIRAPFDSVVVARYASVGQKVAASAPLFLFTRESRNLAAEFSAPQEALKPLRIGALAEIQSDSDPERVLSSKITEISGLPTGGGSVIGRLVIEATKSDGGFAAGSNVTARIEIRSEGRPAEAGGHPGPAPNSEGSE
ncbi:HAD-IC family P-type ATPase [Methylocystis sp. WRRC1]|nr:HAD-IC family P-type ATPase [Methylocystis sp. WRRC1]MCC3244735.1 HAD-IC family P-type ATPase [Methylocystis sp. WRRC1]